MSTRTPARTPVSVKPMVSLLGALCVLAGSTALLVVVDGSGWVGPAVQVVGLVWLIGVGCRLLGAITPVTVLAQVAGVAITVTAVFTNGGYAGLIPNAAAVREADALLTGAWDQILHSSLPAPSTPQLSFLIAITMGLTAIIVDFFVAEVEAPALVALPLLCLYSVPASIAETMLPWWAFVLPALGFTALIAVAGHPGRRVGWRAGIGVGIAAGLVALVSIAGSVVIGDAVTVVGTEGRVQRTNTLAAGSDVGLSTFASLHGDLQRGEARSVLKIRGLPSPDYLRTTALENWDAGQGFSLSDPNDDAASAGSPVQLSPLASDPTAQVADVDVQVLGYVDRFVPYYQGTTVISGLGGGYRYNSSLGSVFQDQPSKPADYRMTVQYGQIAPDLLRQDTVTATPQLVAATGVPTTAVDLARSVTAQGQTAFDKALLLSEFFTDPRNGFVYSLSVPTGNSGSLLTDFLNQRTGYCEQYAAAMTVMLRTLGIPARVAMGFTQGTDVGGGESLITSHDAHAWVEVRFDTYGWVRFDPTPLSPAIGGLPGYQTSAAGPDSTESTGTAASAATATGSGQSQAVATLTDFETVTVAPGSVGATSTPFWKHWYTWAVVVLIVAALLAAVPTLWRRRQARRRLAVARGGGAQAPAAAWAEVEALALDHGLPSRRATTVRRAANQLARDGRLSEHGREGLRRIALGTESAWYSPEGYAAPPDVDLAADVDRIATDLEHSAPRSLSTKLLPRSLVSRE